MKKNININLSGQLYAIDEDAYQILKSYLDSMESYFLRQEGGNEIAEDIKNRVSELLWERKENGQQAVDMETVKTIIKQIGNPSEIDDTNYGHGPEEPDSATLMALAQYFSILIGRVSTPMLRRNAEWAAG